jgi:UDP-N-acetylglucosamine 2-epimerase (non-hydrolysing)
VDDPEILGGIMHALSAIGKSMPAIFPVHPRTRNQLRTIPGLASVDNIHLVDPLGYLEFLALQSEAVMVITDSGGIQEETTYLGIPCLTLRENTERPVTVSVGTNILVGHNMARLHMEATQIIEGRAKRGGVPPLWDGKAGERIASILSDYT